ncbi:MAG TPA: relaxase/mobilization nuclease domain-containing protein [Chromobacteriaceae bacterium]|nr:relaxase/mobilization nuclease domain-containing protein [Chromobacteriaceae bacterium]
MINAVMPNCGTGPIEDAINYLKSDFDHEGTLRKNKPRDFAGDAEQCIFVGNSIDRKHKYVSGSLVFRETEQPTDEQLKVIVDQFRKTFMAGLEYGEHFVDYWNVHTDKGKIELNYVIPLAELTTGRQLNPFPPGQTTYEFKDAFDAVINQSLGYNQVVADPTKASNSKFETKLLEKSTSKVADDFRKIKPTKDEVSDCVAHQIINGKINSRQELCDFLENFGEITRINDKFISIKPYGSEKAFRLKGPAYEHGADFKKIAKAFQSAKSGSQNRLSDKEFSAVKMKLARLIKSRKDFNQSLISKPLGRRNKNRVYGDKKPVNDGGGSIGGSGGGTAPATVKVEEPKSQLIKTEPVKPVEKPTEITASKIDVEPVSTSNDKSPSNNQADDSPGSAPIMSSSSDSGGSVGSLSAELNRLTTEIANTRDPKKLAELEAKAAGVRAKLSSASMAEQVKKLRDSFNQQEALNRKKLKN